jgi:co-chaperonin GroES (HSP10)
MNTPAFRPNRFRYLVLPDEIEAKSTQIGDYRIEEGKDIHQQPSEGTVVAIGRDCIEYQVGAKVLFGKYSGYEQVFDGNRYKILQESEILGERIVTPFDGDDVLSL